MNVKKAVIDGATTDIPKQYIKNLTLGLSKSL